MDSNEEKILKETYNELMNIMTNQVPLAGLEKYADPKVMGFGTTLDEHYTNFDGLHFMVKRQEEQSEGLDFTFTRNPCHQRISIKEDIAVIVEIIHVSIQSNEFSNEFNFRFSAVLEKQENDWKLIHWHGSIPSDIENDTWHIGEWKTEKEKLEKLVAEQTVDLQIKHQELKIEASLERVRAQSMGMHHSSDLMNVVNSLFQEIDSLGITMHSTYILTEFNDLDSGYHAWTQNNEKIYTNKIFLDTNIKNSSYFKDLFKNWQKKTSYSFIYSKQEKNLVFKHNFKHSTELSKIPDKRKTFIINGNGLSGYAAIQQNSAIMFQLYNSTGFKKEEIEIQKRFSIVFEQAYIRFLDLKKAEEQTREAIIEAALERVRSKAMAMHQSEDLLETTAVIFVELQKLGITTIRSGITILNKETKNGKLYAATTTPEGRTIALPGRILMSKNQTWSNVYDSWLAQKEYNAAVSGKELEIYYQELKKGLPITEKEALKEKTEYFHAIPTKVGVLYTWSHTAFKEEEIRVLRRFSSIVDLTFYRYFELKNSESIAQEAVKQASLDRIRAEIASMRTVEDLEKITPLIWKELIALNVPFIRCGVFIMDENPKIVHNYLSTPDGKAIATFQLPYDTPGFVQQLLESWHKNEVNIDYWDKKAMKNFAEILVGRGIIKTPDIYLKSLPKQGFHLHFLPFLQGMLYVGNLEKLDDDQVDLLQSLAKAFSTAYARYEDFNKLEAAKKQAEDALNELKQAQTQLIHSEKMASLGELTAGIAHEIQNPLNFVNNFSEVSNELIDEMLEEMKNGDLEEAGAIAEDVKQNLEKINHHGQRAADIVRSMLQHSRGSNNVKEPTDLNALCDEYLRLAYHGLRAKDKSFNAEMVTEFDDSIGKINIIPQDIGRVLLNLITNAFYAANRGGTSSAPKPLVTITTKKSSNTIIISVSDNGPGIPNEIKDKIFQPFFTTKPTGQGTGLGLSMSFDIVRAYGGQLSVESTTKSGATLTVTLPVT